MELKSVRKTSVFWHVVDPYSALILHKMGLDRPTVTVAALTERPNRWGFWSQKGALTQILSFVNLLLTRRAYCRGWMFYPALYWRACWRTFDFSGIEMEERNEL